MLVILRGIVRDAGCGYQTDTANSSSFWQNQRATDVIYTSMMAMISSICPTMK
jgi:hypothetical protein